MVQVLAVPFCLRDGHVLALLTAPIVFTMVVQAHVSQVIKIMVRGLVVKMGDLPVLLHRGVPIKSVAVTAPSTTPDKHFRFIVLWDFCAICHVVSLPAMGQIVIKPATTVS